MHTAEENAEDTSAAVRSQVCTQDLERTQNLSTRSTDVDALAQFLRVCGFEDPPLESSQQDSDRLVPAQPQPPGRSDQKEISDPPNTQTLRPQGSNSAPRVVVFDFDQTLAVTNTTPSKLVDPVRRVFGGEARVAMLRDLFQNLQRCGVVMVIVSFNSKDTIERALEDSRVGLLDFFRYPVPNMYSSLHFRTTFGDPGRAQAVFGSELLDDIRDWRKSAVVKRILTALDTPAENLLFVDDNSNNCRDVEEHCAGCKTIRIGITMGEWGVTPLHCLHILTWAGSNDGDDGAKRTCESESLPEIEPYFSSTGTCSGDSQRSERSLTGLDDDWEGDDLQ